MENTPQDPAHLRREFQPCRNRFTAFGGKTRQDLLRVLLSPPPAGSAGDRRDKSPKRSDSRLLLSGPAGQWDRKRSAPVRGHSADPEKRSGQERRGLTAAITGGIQLWICSRPWEHRHAVRSYEDRPIAPEAREALLACIAQCNRESGLHIQLVLDEPRGFGGLPAHYGKFSGVKNYIALIGKKSPEPGGSLRVLRGEDRTAGPAAGSQHLLGRHDVQQGQDRLSDRPGEKLCLVIAVGYGTTQGAGHPVKQPEEVSKADSPVPDWFRRACGRHC